MKRLILTLAVLAAPGLAFAQAATTTPDPAKPVSSEWAVTSPTGELTAAGAALYGEPQSDADTAAAEATLREVIASAQGGAFAHPKLSASVAEQMAAQQATLVPLVQGFGAVEAIEYVGVESFADVFLVAFENKLTEWAIGFNGDGTIGRLQFRPVEFEGDAETPAAPAAE